MHLSKWDKKEEAYEDRSVYRRYEDEEDGYKGYDNDDDEDYFDGWGGDSSKYHWSKNKRDD